MAYPSPVPSDALYNRFSMDSSRIADLLRPFLARDSTPNHPPSSSHDEAAALTPAQLQYISIYIDILVRWNSRIRLTAISEPEEIVKRHFGESLFAARCLFPRSRFALANGPQASANVHLVDVGSGAGFPGLPFKFWMPGLNVTLIESNQKKATFLREIVRSLSLSQVDVFPRRAEEFSGDGADIVTLRAVERFDSILPVAARLVTSRGRLALLIGEAQVRRSRELAPGFSWSDPVAIPQSERRVVLIGARA